MIPISERILVIRRLAKSQFARHLAMVAGGTAAAQAISVAFSPIITRLYGPETFGVLGVFTAMAAFVAPGATLAYAIAVVLPTADRDARSLVQLSILTSIGMSSALLLVALLFRDEIAGLLGLTMPSAYLLLLPLVVLCTGCAEALRQWLIRKGQFRAISCVAVTQAAGAGTAMVAVGSVVATAPVLLVLNALGHAVQSALLCIAARGTLRHGASREHTPRNQLDLCDLKRIAHKYRDFPLYRAPQLVLNSASYSVAPLILTVFFGPLVTGFYTISRQVLALPSLLVSQALGTVLLPRLAERAHRGESLQPDLIRATLGLAIVGAVPFGCVILFGPALFALVFGAEWSVAGQYARWMSVWLYFMFLNVPCVQAIPLLGLQPHLLAYEIAAVLARVVGVAVGATVLGSGVGAVALLSVASALLYVLLILWVLHRSGHVIPTATSSSGGQ